MNALYSVPFVVEEVAQHTPILDTDTQVRVRISTAQYEVGFSRFHPQVEEAQYILVCLHHSHPERIFPNDLCIWFRRYRRSHQPDYRTLELEQKLSSHRPHHAPFGVEVRFNVRVYELRSRNSGSADFYALLACLLYLLEIRSPEHDCQM